MCKYKIQTCIYKYQLLSVIKINDPSRQTKLPKGLIKSRIYILIIKYLNSSFDAYV